MKTRLDGLIDRLMIPPIFLNVDWKKHQFMNFETKHNLPYTFFGRFKVWNWTFYMCSSTKVCSPMEYDTTMSNLCLLNLFWRGDETRSIREWDG